MYCNRLHAWWSTQSRLATLLSSLIASWWVGLQTLWWFRRFRLNDLSIDKMVEAWCFCCLSGPPGFDCWNFFMPPKELWEAYSNRTLRPSHFHVRSISPIFFEVGIPNLVCGCILGWRSVAYHFRVTVTLTFTSDLVFRIIVSGAYLWYYWS